MKPKKKIKVFTRPLKPLNPPKFEVDLIEFPKNVGHFMFVKI